MLTITELPITSATTVGINSEAVKWAFMVGLANLNSVHATAALDAIKSIPAPVFERFCEHIAAAAMTAPTMNAHLLQTIIRQWNSQALVNNLPPEISRRLNLPLLRVFDFVVHFLPDDEAEHLVSWLLAFAEGTDGTISNQSPTSAPRRQV